MDHRVDAAKSSQRLGQIHHQVRIDDGNVRRQLIVGDGIFLAGHIIRHHSKWRHLGARARCCRNRNQLGLGTHLGERVDALANVHEAHGKVLKIDLRMFVHDPRNLGRVHGRASAKRDDHVGLKAVGHLDALAHGRQVRIGLHLGEDVNLHAQAFQRRNQIVRHARPEEEVVGHNQRPLPARNVLQSLRNASAAEVDRPRQLVPQRILRALGHDLLVQQVLRADILRHGVPSPASATQRKARRKAEVIQIANAAMRGWRVYQDASGLHVVAEVLDALLLLVLVCEQYGCMPNAAQRNQLRRNLHRVLEVRGAIERKNGGELLMREGFGHGCVRHLADQHLGRRRHRDPSQLGNRWRGLADDLCIHRSFDQNDPAHRLGLLLVEDVPAVPVEPVAHGIVDGIHRNDGLLGCADHAVVKGLRHQDRCNGTRLVGGLVDHHRSIARANANRRCAR